MGERIFFEQGDYRLYLDLLQAQAARAKVAVWGYCLMPNHVHLILAPADEAGLARAVGEAHRRYSGFVNARARRTGHLFQARFSSVPMDNEHALAALRYVALNPVREGLAPRAEDWPWSSARTWLGLGDDGVTDPAAAGLIGDAAAFLSADEGDARFDALRRAELTGRPLGGEGFIDGLEKSLGRKLRLRKRGRKARAKEN